MPRATNIKIGNNTYSKIITEQKNKVPLIEVVGNQVFFSNVKITTGSEVEAVNLKKFITGEEQNIYGTSETIIEINGQSISLNTITDFIEEMYVDLLKSGKYFKLTDKEKIILDIPIIEWNVGYFYGAAFMLHWLKGSGVKIELSDVNKTELLDKSSLFNEKMNISITEINTGKNNYIGSLTGACLKRIGSLISTGQIGGKYEISYGADYEPASVDSKDYRSCFKIFNVSGFDLLGGLNSTIDEDIVAGLGSFSLNYNFSGTLEVFGIDRGVLTVNNVAYRIWDSFDFNDGFWGSQNLGRWKKDPFSPERPTTIYGGVLIENKDFRGLYGKISKNSNIWDYQIVSKYYPVIVEIDGFNYSVDFFGNVTPSVY